MKKIYMSALILSFTIITFLISMQSVNGYDPGLSGKYYQESTVVQDLDITFQHYATNSSSEPDTVQFSVSRTMSFYGSLTSTLEVDAVLYKTGVEAEIGYGLDETVTTTMTWVVPAYSSVICRYGSAGIYTTGNMQTWVRGRLVSSIPVYADYTTMSYSDKTQV
jgi:hypothetical protein